MARTKFIDEVNAYGLRLVIQDMGGEPREIDIDRASLAKMGGSDIRALLFQAGLRTEADGDFIAVQCLKAADPEDEILVARKPGWVEIQGAPDPVYVCPGGEIIGAPEGYPFELSVAARISATVARKGTLEGWKAAAAIAVAVPGCEHWTLGVIAGFAGVLISLTGLDSCGINFSGMTTAGKTTAQKLAASVWSRPSTHKESLFQSARTTVNGMELTAARSNGTVLILDELAHVSGKELARMIYTLAGGTGKKRMTAEASDREGYTWSTFVILSAENSLEERIRADKDAQWSPGMTVRIPDIDVTGVNRRVPKPTMEEIEAISAHYGHAGPAFVEHLIASGLHRRPDEIKRAIDTFAKRFAGEADGAVMRAARVFAIIQCAGELAREFGLLPESLDVSRATTWAWNRYRQSNDAAALDPSAQAIANLRLFVAERWGHTIHDISNGNPTREAHGWFDAECIYIPAKRLVEAAGGGLKEQEVARALDEAGFIAKRKAIDVRYVDYVPKVGKGVKAYALPRDHFGRDRDKIAEEWDANITNLVRRKG